MSKYIDLNEAIDLFKGIDATMTGGWVADTLEALPTIEVSDDYISRAFALEVIDDCINYPTNGDKTCAIKNAPSVTPKPIMTEEVREAIMRLTMCAREECTICKYENDCGFDKQVEMATENMNIIANAFEDAPSVVPSRAEGEWISGSAITTTTEEGGE